MRRATEGAVNRQAVRAVAKIAMEARLEQAAIRAISAVGEYAVSEVEYLKRIQHQAEMRNPDTAEAVAAIVNITVASIARRVSRFGNEIDW